jgi:flagellar biosynthesis/type III secretory pathway protein FliH
MFSEDELEAAKMIAHEKGRNQGIMEERQKREQFTADILNRISDNFASLFAAETYREKQYEEESLKLALEILDMIAPSLNNRLGEESLKSALHKILKQQSEQSEIVIEVHPESASDIDKLMTKLWPDQDSAPRYKILADNSLEKGACRLAWEDGGMIRNPSKTANDIKKAIETLLVEQVMANGNSSLTDSEKNAIKNQQLEESASQSSSKDSRADQNGDG